MMVEFFGWFTSLENSKVLALILFFTVFCGIVIYLYSSKSRSEQLEAHKYIPLQDDEYEAAADTDDEGKNQ